MSTLSSLDVAGRRRSPATYSQFHRGRAPRNKSLRYPADPPSVEEIVAVMRRPGDGLAGDRMRVLIVVLWRARPADPGGARPLRARPRPAPRRAADRSGGRPPAPGRGGRLGLGAPRCVGLAAARAASRSAVLHHLRPDPRAAVAADRRARGCAGSQTRPPSAGASFRTSSVTLTQSSWRARACR